jgi:hypothetical protein
MKQKKSCNVIERLIVGFSLLMAVMLFSADAKAQGPKRIEFEKGKSSATVRGVTGQNGTTYLIRARSGQKIVLTLGPRADVGIKVEGSGRFGHTVLLREERGGTYTVGLEESGEYTIFVGSTNHRTLPFTLSVRIDRMTDI